MYPLYQNTISGKNQNNATSAVLAPIILCFGGLGALSVFALTGYAGVLRAVHVGGSVRVLYGVRSTMLSNLVSVVSDMALSTWTMLGKA